MPLFKVGWVSGWKRGPQALREPIGEDLVEDSVFNPIWCMNLHESLG